MGYNIFKGNLHNRHGKNNSCLQNMQKQACLNGFISKKTPQRVCQKTQEANMNAFKKGTIYKNN